MDPRQQMIREIEEKYGLNSPGVFTAMKSVPREEFVPSEYKHLTYNDSPIPIGFGQTISQPYTVAFMTDLLKLKGKEKVLEVGTGSGYQAAVLSLLAEKVYTVERIKGLGDRAKKTLKKLGYKNVFVKVGKGEKGWKEKSPFDAIIITAGVRKVPKQLFGQLENNGVLVAPVGRGMDKSMMKYTKVGERISKKEFGIFHFVPLIT